MTPSLPSPPAERLAAAPGPCPALLGAALLGAALLALLLLALTLPLARPAAAAPMAVTPSGAPGPEVPAIEWLRLQVPAEQRQAWWAAEQESWGPWLAQQEGFQGRELYWDPQRQQGVVLIRWASRARWKAIPAPEVAAVQQRFEERARAHLQLAGLAAAAEEMPPFPLVEEGELQEGRFRMEAAG